ncbi:MAG: hypothetical protein M1819_005486 [Sarea resinae]|nr:MAG: hypothetical protein M1819_005486 [Sarea resinae]
MPKEIDRFLSDTEGNAFKHADMLALIFAALALGLQNGVFDRNGGQWVQGAMESELSKGDVYIAAAMQALRLASFTNRPSLLGIQALIMIGPYLTNGGKFLDAWGLFGITIRLAQSIGLHRHHVYLDPAPPLRECGVRQALWWWMLHMDQQYSMTLGRPLGISGIGDCPPPEPLTTNRIVQRVSQYINQFTIVARQILSSDRLSTPTIDEFTDRLLGLMETLPEAVRFDKSWLDPNKETPEWPLDAIAAFFYGKTHNYLGLLNKQRRGDSRTDGCRGRDRVLASARASLDAFEFYNTRARAAMVCWTMGQMAFNSAMILIISMLETGELDDMWLVHRTYASFLEMHQKGIHRLAGLAVEKLTALLELFDDPSAREKDSVMGQTGMLLLEDPGLQGFIGEGFAPLGFQMVGGDLAGPGVNNGTPSWAARPAGPNTSSG